MSFFKKPKRNLRTREIDTYNDEEGSESNACVSNIPAQMKGKNGSPKKAMLSKKQNLLSFGEEFDQGDDGEVFQVKKSSYSKKIRKQMEKEKKKKPVKQSAESQVEKKAEEEIEIKIINPIKPVKMEEKILSGYSAEMADYRSDSDEENENSLHRYTHCQSDGVNMLLKSGKIPDAALIHELRRRRQQAREFGSDFLPIQSSSDGKVSKTPEHHSRLIREGDSDEEERITMSGIVSDTADKEKNREGLHSCLSSDEDDLKMDEWEDQQIRKGVRGAQLGTVHIDGYTAVIPSANEPTRLDPSFMASLNTPCLDPESAARNLKERLEKLRQTYKSREGTFGSVTKEMESLRVELEECRAKEATIALQFQFYQDLRGYVTDLVECLDEKVPLIESLDERVQSIYEKQATELMMRRRQDTKDQTDDLFQAAKLRVDKSDDDKVKRRAEREGRRIRRSKKRDLLVAINHADGMSTDDEMPESSSSAFRSQRELIECDTKRVFEDVVDEFVKVDEILGRFYAWKQMGLESYKEAYGCICLAKILGPLIRWQMVLWNPLLENHSLALLDDLDWMKSVMMYGADVSNSEKSLQDDLDSLLVPKLLEKIVVPKLQELVKIQWDPLSCKQTKNLSVLIKSLLDYPIIGVKSVAFSNMMEAVVAKMKAAVENDVYIPMLPKQLVDTGTANVFFQRQFNICLKLLSNLLLMRGLVNESILLELTAISLLNRYLLIAIRMLPPFESGTKCLTVGKLLPLSWFRNSLPEISQFVTYAKELTARLNTNDPHEKDLKNKLVQCKWMN